MSRNSFIFLIVLLTTLSCSLHETRKGARQKSIQDDYFSKVYQTRCEKNSKLINYKIGDLVCTRNSIKINSREHLEVRFITVNKESDDPYEYGHQELHRYQNGKIIQTLKLRRDDDAYWSEVPFVRIRKQRYLADLDGDGFLEFAVLPFHPGSAIWMSARIFSLKEKIEDWGEGRYQFEGDTFVQLGCMKCSKFNPDACKSCY